MIDSYKFGHIVIDGKPYTSDVIIYPDRVESRWWRKEGHSLCMDDIQDILAGKPEVLVLGQGKPGLMKVPDGVRTAIRSRGIELFVSGTRDAVEKYNELSRVKKVAAALHLTC